MAIILTIKEFDLIIKLNDISTIRYSIKRFG